MNDAPVTVIATIDKNQREEIRVALSAFKGVELVDLRVFADSANAPERIATKKGLACRVGMLPALIVALQDAEAEARRRGLIGGAA